MSRYEFRVRATGYKIFHLKFGPYLNVHIYHFVTHKYILVLIVFFSGKKILKAKAIPAEAQFSSQST